VRPKTKDNNDIFIQIQDYYSQPMHERTDYRHKVDKYASGCQLNIPNQAS
jgi:hypothetical protein